MLLTKNVTRVSSTHLDFSQNNPTRLLESLSFPSCLPYLRGLALAVLDGVLGDDLPLADLLWRPLHDARVAHLKNWQKLCQKPWIFESTNAEVSRIKTF